MLMLGPLSASGGITMLTREPSGSRPSTIGVRALAVLPSGLTMRSTMFITCPSSTNLRRERQILPLRSMKISLGELTMISEIVGSLSRYCIGPNPRTSFRTSSKSTARRLGMSGFSSLRTSFIHLLRDGAKALAVVRFELLPAEFIHQNEVNFVRQA